MTGEGTVGPKIDERIALRMGWSIAASGFLVQMATNGRYGYFRDEFYWEEMVRKVAGYTDDHVGVEPRERRKSVWPGGRRAGERSGIRDGLGALYDFDLPPCEKAYGAGVGTMESVELRLLERVRAA